MNKRERKVFLKLLKPKCFGNWDCLIEPRPDNFYYPPRDGSWVVYDEEEEYTYACPWADECRKINKKKWEDLLKR